MGRPRSMDFDDKDEDIDILQSRIHIGSEMHCGREDMIKNTYNLDAARIQRGICSSSFVLLLALLLRSFSTSPFPCSIGVSTVFIEPFSELAILSSVISLVFYHIF